MKKNIARMKRIARHLRLFSLILAILCVVSCSKVTTGPIPNQTGVPRCVRGEIDFRNWDFSSMRGTSLDGDWDFRWKRLLWPDDPEWAAPTGVHGYYPVPLFWTEYSNGSFPVKGFASYRIRVHTSGSEHEYGILIPELFTEYRLWINGKMIMQNGIEPGSPVHYLHPTTLSFYCEKADFDIVLQIKNSRHANSGIGQSFILGSPRVIFREYIASIALEIILIAVCLFAGMYHLVIYLFRRAEPELLCFGLFCVVIAIRTFTTGSTMFTNLFPMASFEPTARLATVVIPLATIFFTGFAWYFFGKPGSKRLTVAIVIPPALFLLLAVFTPSLVSSSLNFISFGSILLSSIWIVSVATHAAILKKPYARFFILSFLVLTVGSINDMLHYMQIIRTGYFLALFASAFILFQAVMLAVRFALEHRTVLELSGKLKAMDKLKDDFLAHTSHELRTPLSGIIGVSESLIGGATGELREDTTRNLNLIVSSGKRLYSLVNDILDYSRLKNNDIVIRCQAVDMRQLVSVVLTVAGTMANNPMVRLINDIPEDTPLVEGDENRLQQILYNLVGNSLKFTRQGHIRVFCEICGSYLSISIEDTGIGIAPERLETIFDSFEQSNGTVSREYGGTGIGLSITRELVKLHGGILLVESEEGTGSVFSFTIPCLRKRGTRDAESVVTPVLPIVVERHTAEAPEVKEVSWDGKKDTWKKHSILVVDDEVVNIQVLLNFLAVSEYATDFATDGHRALELIGKKSYDLILLDIMMPRLSGYEVCKKIRERFSAHDLPIIFLTAKNQVQDIVTAFDVGGNDYLVKPLNQAELLARIKMHIMTKQAVHDAIENARLASTDPLTALHNRRFFMEAGLREFAIANRLSRSLSVIMLDVDNFKAINDSQGHDYGDRVLLDLTGVITGSIRSIDIPGRFGGDEFLVLLPGAELEDAASAAERIRSLAEKAVLANGGMRYTVSIGVAEKSSDTPTFDALLQKVDRMLYESKKKGRNLVSTAS